MWQYADMLICQCAYSCLGFYCFNGLALDYLCALKQSNMVIISTPLHFLSIFQGEHMIFILIAILLLFGGKKIPELMRGLGRGVREFNDAKNHVRNEIESNVNDKDRANTPSSNTTASH